MSPLAAFALGALVGAAVVGIMAWLRRKDALDLAREAVAQAQNRQQQDLEAVLGRVKDAFGSLSLDALSKVSVELGRQAGDALAKHSQAGASDLSTKKQLIDQALHEMSTGLHDLQGTLSTFEKDRSDKYSEISNQLKTTAEQTSRLLDTTTALRTALAGAKTRGQWGERMAEDVMQMAGLIENINYRKQKAMESGTSIPDYTFLLPNGYLLNMDVKFPLDNYVRYLESEADPQKSSFKDAFLSDVKDRLKEVTTRDYIDPTAKTVDYVLVFIPNEQVYSFINESDHDLLVDALRKKVVVCSPLTLYAVLAVVRQAFDNFHVEQTAGEVLSLLAKFDKQWHAFVKSFDKIGQKLNDAREEFDKMATTRRNQLERPLNHIRELRTSGRIPVGLLPESTDDEAEPAE